MGLMEFAGGTPAEKGRMARGLVEAGKAVIVDVRTPEEFAAAHLPGALNLPVGELPARLGELPRGKVLVLYCRSGARSASAEQVLRDKGFETVIILTMANYP